MSEAAAAAGAAPAGGSPAPGAPKSGQPPAQKQGETPAQAEARRVKLRLGDQEVELDERELATNYQKGRDASKLLSKVEQRRQEALRAKMEADGILGRLKDKGNLRTVLRDLGYTAEDLRSMGEREILDAIELEKMTPAERRAYEAEQKLKEYEAERDKVKQTEAEKARAEEVARHKDEFAGLFLATFEGLGLPKQSARFVMHRMAHLYQQNEAAGLESTPEEMASYVLEGIRNEHRGVLSGLEGEALIEHLGPDVVKKVLSVHLAKARAKRGMGGQEQPQRVAQAQPEAKMDPRKGRWALIEQMTKG